MPLRRNPVSGGPTRRLRSRRLQLLDLCKERQHSCHRAGQPLSLGTRRRSAHRIHFRHGRSQASFLQNLRYKEFLCSAIKPRWLRRHMALP
ncbi:UNVERIFIED_CONTAM: hypothetical protein GTU68_029939 [Idotea baltica]|nr:hypothetical protein [Idotea baltica]